MPQNIVGKLMRNHRRQLGLVGDVARQIEAQAHQHAVGGRLRALALDAEGAGASRGGVQPIGAPRAVGDRQWRRRV